MKFKHRSLPKPSVNSFGVFLSAKVRYFCMIFFEWTPKLCELCPLDSAVLCLMTHICPSRYPHVLQMLLQPALNPRRLSCTNHFQVPVPLASGGFGQ